MRTRTEWKIMQALGVLLIVAGLALLAGTSLGSFGGLTGRLAHLPLIVLVVGVLTWAAGSLGNWMERG